jgi:hypothetical protein
MILNVWNNAVYYVLWDTTRKRVEKNADLVPLGHRQTEGDQRFAHIVMSEPTRLRVNQHAHLALRGRSRIPLDHRHAIPVLPDKTPRLQVQRDEHVVLVDNSQTSVDQFLAEIAHSGGER